MKLAFTTLGNPDWSFDKTLDEAQRMGFEAIEIRGIEGKMRADEITQFLEQNQYETKAKLASHKLEICGFGTSVKFDEFDKYEDYMAEGKTAIDICSQMGIPSIRVFGDRIVSKDIREAVIQNTIKGIRQLCSYAVGKNVKVLLETHGDFNTIENVTDVINGVKDRTEFGILWDIEHTDKVYGNDYMKFYDQVKHYILHVHIKDHLKMDGEYRLCMVGEGNIPIKSIVRTLNADGYAGYMSLEWEKKWHRELPEPEIAYPAYVKFMQNI